MAKETTTLAFQEDQSYEEHMMAVRGESVSTNASPVLKFKGGKIMYVLGDKVKEFDELKGVRIVYKTNFYQLTEKIGDDFKNVASSNEYLQGESFNWYEDDEVHTFATGKELREYLGELPQTKKLNYINIVYFDLPEFGIVKSYMKLSKTVGVTKEKDGTTIYHFNDPMEDSLGEQEKAFRGKLSDMVFTMSTKTYTYGDTANVCYPVFTDDEAKKDPEIVGKTLGIINNIKDSIIARAHKETPDTVQQAVEVVEGSDDLPF